MKTIAKATLILFVLCALAHAGDNVTGVKGVGIKLGFGYATLSADIDNLFDRDSFGSGTFGAYLNYGLSPKLSLQPELLFVAKGEGGSFLRGRSWRHDYLEVPVLLKYCLLCDSKLKPSVYIGTAFSFLLSSEFKSSMFTDTKDTKDAMKSLDLSFVIGGAIDYRRFSLDIRYTIGMVDTYDAAEWNELVDAEDSSDLYYMPSGESVKNRYLSFTLGYRFWSAK